MLAQMTNHIVCQNIYIIAFLSSAELQQLDRQRME